MAEQTGVITLRKAVGNVSFYGMNGKKYARTKTVIPAERIRTAPEFENTRKANVEFGRASDVSKVFRDAFGPVVGLGKNVYVAGLLTAQALLAIQADPTNTFGNRNFADGDPAMLVGFQFNSNAPFDSIFKAPYTIAINRTPGTVVLTVPIFDSQSLIVNDPAATHWRLSLGSMEVNWATGETTVDTDRSAWVAVGTNPTTLITVTGTLSAASTDQEWAVIGIEFAKLVGAQYNVLNNKAFNGTFIAAADV